MDFKEERNMILDMVAEGRITVDDAKSLLDALEKSSLKKHPETTDDFFVTPGMDFHVPEVHIPNVNRIVRQAIRNSVPGYRINGEEMDEVRANLREEMESLREQMELLAEEIKEKVKEAAREQHRHTEEWE